MKISDIISVANASLLRNKARTFLTIIAIFIGATTLSLTNGIGTGLKSYINSQLGNLGNSYSLTITANVKKNNQFNKTAGLQSYNPNQKKIVRAGGGPNGVDAIVALSNNYIAKISKINNIVSVQPVYVLSPDYISTASNPTKKFQFNIGQTFGKATLDIADGRNVNLNSNNAEITIPTTYLSSLGFSNNNQALSQVVNIGVTNALGQQSVVSAKIVGIQQKTLLGSAQAYGNTVLTNQIHNIESQGLTAVNKDSYASLDATYKTNLTATQVTTLKNALTKAGYTGKTIQDQISTIFTIINAITDILDFFAIITLIAASFGIINTLFMSVQERTREIGLMKALGMSKFKIFILFSFEAVLIGFWGSILGIGFANIIGAVINNIATKGFLQNFTGLSLLSFPSSSSTIIVVGIMLIAFLAGTLPARRAAKKDPIDALRYE